MGAGALTLGGVATLFAVFGVLGAAFHDAACAGGEGLDFARQTSSTGLGGLGLGSAAALLLGIRLAIVGAVNRDAILDGSGLACSNGNK